MLKRRTAKIRLFHYLRAVSNAHYRWHCKVCEKYFTRYPKAATCKGQPS